MEEIEQIEKQYGKKFVKYFQTLNDKELQGLIDRMLTNQLEAGESYMIITALTFTSDSIY